MKIKVTEMGGYVYGDGALPDGFNADLFMKAFGNRIMDAKLQGIEDLDVEPEELEAIMRHATLMVEESKEAWSDMLDAAPVHELPDNADLMSIPAQMII